MKVDGLTRQQVSNHMLQLRRKQAALATQQCSDGPVQGGGGGGAGGNAGTPKEWTPIEEGCKACSREVGGGQGENRVEGPVTRGGPTVLDSEGGVITSRLCETCAKLWKADGKPNPWFPANGPGGSRGPKPRWRKPVGTGV
jgi:hypothetical protein